MREYNILLDITAEDNNSSDIWFIQNDIGGKLYLSLVDNGVAIDLTDKRVIAFFENKEKTVSQKDVLITNYLEGKGEIEISNSILSVVGNIKMEVKLYKGVELKATFTPVTIKCKKSMDVDNAVTSTKEIDVLQTIYKNSEDIKALDEKVAKDLLATKEEMTGVINGVNDTLNKRVDLLTENVNKSISDINSSVDTKVLELTNSVGNDINNLQLAVNRDMESLNTSVNNSIEALNTSVNQNITSLTNNVNESITAINNNVTQNVEALNKKVTDTALELNNSVATSKEELTSLVNTTVDNINKVIDDNINTLDNSKLDVIVSATEPPTETLKIGTIWVKPIGTDEA